MAGLIAALFGGRSRQPAVTNPLPGVGGYALGAGPANQTGFPGSTSQTRTFQGNNPRAVKVRGDTNTGFEQALSDTAQIRQASYRGDVPGAGTASPRSTAAAATRQPLLTALMQATAATFFGGPMLKTGEGNNTAGGVPSRGAAAAGGHSQYETTTPWALAQPVIGSGTPGANNVRNQVAQRYKNAPGQFHTYRSAARADQAPVNRGGQATDGNVHPDRVSQEVTVPNRFQFAGTGSQTWAVLREMPYGGRGDGARGAQLSGQRYYATGQSGAFWNAGQGDYGIARERGGKRPVSFTEPAPWTTDFYDTTAGVAGQSTGQSPSTVYVSPSAGRASNSTGRRA
jgi:hypothetical protein